MNQPQTPNILHLNPKPAPDNRKPEKLTNVVRAMLSQPSSYNPEKTNAEAIAEAWIEQILAGNARLLSELLDRLEGRVPPPRETESGDTIAKIDELLAKIDEACEMEAGYTPTEYHPPATDH